MKKYLLLLVVATASFSSFAVLPDSIANGSDFYIIYMDNMNQESLVRNGKVTVPKMIRDYDVWPDGTSLESSNPVDAGAWGAPITDVDDIYLSFKVASTNPGWNGGAIIADLNLFEEAPNLKDITDNPGDYYFHFAIKSPYNQPNAGLVLFFYSDGTPTTQKGDGGAKYFVGPDSTFSLLTGTTMLGNYVHNGSWQHFEIPVAHMKSKGYEFDGPLHVWHGENTVRVYLIGFQSLLNDVGTEINLDAMFFYKKPVVSTERINPPAVESALLSVYPNPAGNTLYIKGTDGRVAARIHDLTGKMVLSQVLSKERIDVSGLARGVYFLKINNQTVKFIKK